MNRIFRVVWSRVRSAYVVVGEMAQCSRGSVRSEAVGSSAGVIELRLRRRGILALECMLAVSMIGGATYAQAAQTFVGGIFTSLGGGSATNPTCYSTVYSPYGNTNGGVASGFSGITQDNVSSGPTAGINYYGSDVICGSADAATQTNRILAFNTGSTNNATNLSVGGTLYANTAAYLNNATIHNLTVTGSFAMPYFVANSSLPSGTATGSDSIAIGMGTTSASGSQSIAQGVNAIASNTNAIALGANSTAIVANSVALGSGSSAAVAGVNVTSATVGSQTYSGFAGTTPATAGIVM
ncbi:hypothetical protein BN2475_300003 [Paraburkholderia ribeironis]|uniref:ESPR domain-containing protein n=1 Tax=Paraburkholderia ribeironis TaxID=1247936 RepID=A0A1N7S1U9_9BURK|nr:ESPR-type extended signal peptide-containing protein [Paraburkholderia ribeironis]SIT41352.1 hypothetical protein BN2475_300003 [Paraburkholderia ribeironis]